MDRRNLQELSKVRLKEARALLRIGLGDGAYYLAGYAVECALKACIEGMRLGGQMIGDRFIEDAYVYRIS